MNWSRVNARLDLYDVKLCRLGLLGCADWEAVRKGRVTRLYAGQIFRDLPQFRTHYGLSLNDPSSRNLRHDVRDPMPIPDGCLATYQSEDVFEHVPYGDLPAIFDELFRVLRPGGLFRLSVPDYRNDVYFARSLRDASGELLFDPIGGGEFKDGKVICGGHVWFPRYETVKALFDASKFAWRGSVEFLHYTEVEGAYVLRDIDYSLGHISRTPDHDDRVRAPRRPLSIVVDARKARLT
jgi:predicted SAM-dependent methyltransferase